MLTVACSQDEAKPADSSNAIAEIKTMNGEELVAQNSAKKKDDILIIDVRSPEEYKAGHIPHAININVDEFEDRINEVEDYKNKPIITYCNSGKKSHTAAEILVNNGFQDLTTPTAEAVGFFFANIPLTYFQEKDAEAELGRTTLERKAAFQEGKVCANYAVLSAILFIFLGLSLGCLVSCLFFFDK